MRQKQDCIPISAAFKNFLMICRRTLQFLPMSYRSTERISDIFILFCISKQTVNCTEDTS